MGAFACRRCSWISDMGYKIPVTCSRMWGAFIQTSPRLYCDGQILLTQWCLLSRERRPAKLQNYRSCNMASTAASGGDAAGIIWQAASSAQAALRSNLSPNGLTCVDFVILWHMPADRRDL